MIKITRLDGKLLGLICECGHHFYPVHWNNYKCDCKLKKPVNQ